MSNNNAKQYGAIWLVLGVLGLLVSQALHAQNSKDGSAGAGNRGPFNSELVRERLQIHYKQWRGTRHRYGGTTKKGVDCSAFIAITFKDQFQLALPRSVSAQAKVGVKINKKQLRPGDLVFFKTRVMSKHIGVYMGEGKFMHVSSKKGVMISALTDDYWAKKYWHARRVT